MTLETGKELWDYTQIYPLFYLCQSCTGAMPPRPYAPGFLYF